MVATFVVEDGTGLANANAYVDVAYADQYHENYGSPSEWSTALLAEKEAAIREATRYLDAAYSGRFRGTPANEDQALDWPRSGVVDTGGWPRDSDSVPVEVKDATCIMALKARQGVALLPDLEGSEQNIVSESVSVGPISESKTYAPKKTSFRRFSIVEATLRPILEQTGRRERA